MSPKRKLSQIHDTNNNGKQKILRSTKRSNESNTEPSNRSSRRRTRSAKELEESPSVGKVQVVEQEPKPGKKNLGKGSAKKSVKSESKKQGNKRKAQQSRNNSIKNKSGDSDSMDDTTLTVVELHQKKIDILAEQDSVKRKSKTNCVENGINDFKNIFSSNHVKIETDKTDNNDKAQEHPSSDSSSESEWEDVADATDEEREPVIPKEGVEITLEASTLFNRKRKKKQFDLKDFLRMRVNRFKKEVQMNLHKVHLLCLLARGLFINKLCLDDMFKGLTLSVIPSEFQSINIKKANDTIIKQILNWYKREWKLENVTDVTKSHEECLMLGFDLKIFENAEVYVCAFVIILRNLGFDVRLVIAFHPLSFKPKDLIKRKSENTCNASTSSIKESNKTVVHKNKSKNTNDKKASGESSKKLKSSKKLSDNSLKIEKDKDQCSSSRKGKPRVCVKKPVVDLNGSEDESDDELTSNQKIKTSTKLKENANTWSSDDDFEVKIIREHTPKPTKFKKNRKIKSEDEEEDDATYGDYFWVEIYLESEKKWLCIDCISNRINCTQHMEAQTNRPLSYVVAFDNQNNVKDVTQRYAENWMSQTQKLRIDSNWWNETLLPFRGNLTDRDKEEDSALENNLLERPLPSTIGEFKNHQLYVLKRHLLKFEAIYPPDAPPVGFIRGEPVYARECVKTLHSRETWLKEARMVRVGEEPYKIVKARPKRNRWTGEMESNQPLEVYGIWQTEEYIPPVASNGKVPRNEYGNVELFKPSMLPIGTVVIKVPGLNRVARKLGIDCAPAMIGWDYHSGGSHPLYDGWVVCEEFHDTLMDAWHEQQKILEEKEREKRDKRIYGNWRRLIKGLLIRERLKARYTDTEES